ncbi:hypothetical protein RM780_10065 [Streptomyces sp. DSM 44917]|uniref:Uncharacterized protein n=1 Tax=Streptomyces boetiae TaxID=3075541 RepID=A0ABU2L6W1_9ACTN|nr:hypothetical protein [Streptomyces sp. DSM 44917]MDT0307307.1 hypothetical protein [Streptomyces sp. DSM 44917]
MRLPDFPHDLIRDQHAWNVTYAELAVAGPSTYAALRRRLIWLSCRIAVHPFWAADQSRAAWGELRRRVREAERREARRAGEGSD